MIPGHGFGLPGRAWSARLVFMMSAGTGKNRFIVAGLLIMNSVLAQPDTTWAQETGEQLFQSTCSACHSIGGGRLVGPDLAGVKERRSQAWLEQFIKSPQAMIKSGDAQAVALAEEFSGMLMPDLPMSDAQIAQLLRYIEATGATPSVTADESAIEKPAAVEPILVEHVIKGQALFQGTARLQNGGPACNSCHDVTNDAVIGGGVLAIELTTVFSKLGGSGVGAILGQAPFPVMQAAYKDKSLTDDEITYLVAFLRDADEQHLFHQPRDYGLGLFVSGLIGAGIMFLLFAIIWRGRKIGPVHQKIYDRQIKSVQVDSIP